MKRKLVTILTLCVMICALLTSLTACSTLDSLLENLGNGGASHEHIYNKRVATENYLANDATCLEKAIYYYSCECGDVGSTTFEQGFGKHEYSDWVSNGDNTHTKTCALDSTHVLTEECSGGSATRSEKAICNKCNTEYGEILGPSLENLFKYTLNEDNSSYTVNVFEEEIVSKYENTEDFFVDYEEILSLKEITIPSKYKGLPVTAIGDFAFTFMGIENIVIPNSIKTIGFGAFTMCQFLESIEIPNSVTSIGYQALAFCTSLTSVEIPESVISIGSIAFYNCSSLTSITIGDGVTSIGEDAFYNCNSLTSITVDENNPNYKSIDGNLYSKDGKTLIQYATGKKVSSFTIPNIVTTIGDGAFYACDSLTSITIPDSVTSIGYGAFSSCDSLETIYCQAESQPSGWVNYWKSGCDAQVVWGYEGE